MNTTKQKLFGFKGAVEPSSVVKDLTEKWRHDEISFSIKDGVFEVNFSSADEKEKAFNIANLYVHAWNSKHNIRVRVNFNHSWALEVDEGAHHSLTLSDEIKVSERVITHRVSFEVGARIVGKSDSASFMANRSLVEKSMKDASLRKSLEFFSNEVVDEKRPLYGVYKAINILVAKFGKKGRKELAALAGKPEKYVDAVMETTQKQRHAISPARILLSEQECRERTKRLIDAYANSV